MYSHLNIMVVFLLSVILSACSNGGGGGEDLNSSVDVKDQQKQQEESGSQEEPEQKPQKKPKEKPDQTGGSSNNPPVISITGNTTAYVGYFFVLTANASDSDGSVVSIRWYDRNDNEIGSGSSLSITENSAGDYTFYAEATDNDGATARASISVTVYPKRLKKTGQVKSYDENGNEVTDGSVKDDGYYQKGVAPIYTRDDTKEIVTDTITGLQWQDDADAKTVTKPWLTQTNYDICTGSNGQTQDTSKCSDTSGDTAATYCSNLTLGGYSDWRLPSNNELIYIIDRSKSNPAIDSTFQNIVSNYYWSSTTRVYNKSYALDVTFNMGNGYWDDKASNNYVRCVRDGN